MRMAEPTGTDHTFEAAIDPAWIDRNGHMSAKFYLPLFIEAGDRFCEQLGFDQALREAGQALVTVENLVCYRREVPAGADLLIESRLLTADAKRLHLYQELRRGSVIHATAEHLMLQVDLATGRVSEFAPQTRARLAKTLALASRLAPPLPARRLGAAQVDRPVEPSLAITGSLG